MDLFRSSREKFQSLDVMQPPVGSPSGAPRAEDRSLKKAPAPQGLSSDQFLMSNALGTNNGGMNSFGGTAPDSTSLGGDNFVLEWAYSVDPDDWQKLDRLNEKVNNTSKNSSEDPGSGSDGKSEDKGSSGDGSSGKDAGARVSDEADEEYVPEEDERGRGGRKRRATARAAITEDAAPPYTDDGSAKRKCTWRKYGQKVLKGKDFVGMDVIRCYYRCNVRGCKVKKQVEKASWQTNSEANVTITGIHTHPFENDSVEDENDEPPADHAAGALQVPGTRGARHARDPLPVPPLNKTLSNEIRDSSPHFVISDPSKPDCPIIFASPGFCRLTGYSLGECVGRNCRFLQGKDSNPNAIRQISQACMTQKEIRVIILNYKKNGQPFWNLLHITPVKDQQGNLISFVGVQMDVSERYASL